MRRFSYRKRRLASRCLPAKDRKYQTHSWANGDSRSQCARPNARGTRVDCRRCAPQGFLIFQMVTENPSWGAPRIHGELLMLGFDVSERTISRWMKRVSTNPDPAKRWLAFLRNHKEAIAAMDFFTVPTVTFSVLHCFFIISHDRRRILHFNVTKHPTSLWIVQQLREAFPFDSAPEFLIFDRDTKYGLQVPAAVRSLNTSPVQTSFQSPWQKDYASHCTSWVRCDTTLFGRRRWDSFTPWAFRGGLSPGCSYR